MKRIWLMLVVIMCLALPAQAHPEHEIKDWLDGWHERVEARGAVSANLIAEYIDWHLRHPCSEVLGTACAPVVTVQADSNPTVALSGQFIPAVEQWRTLVETYFGPNTNAALSVMQCESRGDAHAQNPYSSASGLFQFLESTWKTVTGESNHSGVFDGSYNIMAAHKLSKGGTNWGPWSCKP